MKQNLAKLILRLGAAGMMIPHGYGKLLRWIEQGMSASFADPIGIGEIPSLAMAIFAELICPVLILIGFKTRWAAIPPAITMIVAAFIVHIDDPWSKMEFPLLYLTCYLAIALLGPGRWSVDGK